MAGAYAYIDNMLCEAVFSVKNESTGYDARRDCIIGLVTPPYTYYTEDDDDWEGELRFYEQFSKGLKYVDNVQLIIREQGCRKEKNSLRVKELADRVKQNANGHGIFVIVFVGPPGAGAARKWATPGVTYTRSVVATPVFYSTFDGAATVASMEAVSDREVNMIFSADFSWNSKTNRFHELPESDREWVNIYHGAYRGHYYPNEVYGEHGAVMEVCRAIYGEQAGTHIAKALCLRLIDQTEIIPLYHPESLICGRRNWNPYLDKGTFRECMEYWVQTKVLTEEGLSLLRRGRAETDFHQEYAGDIDWKIQVTELGLVRLEFLRLESKLGFDGGNGALDRGVGECEVLLRQAEEFIKKNFPAAANQFFQGLDMQASEDKWTPQDNVIFPENGLLSNMRLWEEMLCSFGQELDQLRLHLENSFKKNLSNKDAFSAGTGPVPAPHWGFDGSQQ